MLTEKNIVTQKNPPSNGPSPCQVPRAHLQVQFQGTQHVSTPQKSATLPMKMRRSTEGLHRVHTTCLYTQAPFTYTQAAGMSTCRMG